MTEHQDKLGEKNGGVFFKLKQQTCYSVKLCVVEVQIQMYSLVKKIIWITVGM